ncbi:YHYH protein [Loktanella sp. R86503]|uniref:YHYH protein n=1 Tax=Loktanella sp. R86503 TaxID=3093847 RepID=UPI0036DDC3D0
MRTFVLTTLICCTAIPAFAHESDDAVLHDITHLFDAATVVSGPEVVDCTLSGGAKTTCFSITVKPEPQSYTPGPWCPTSINDSADKGGIWLENGQVNDVDGAFVANLSTFYDDPEWQLFDEATGKVRVTDTQEACEAAARPDVDPAYNNYCVQCLPEYLPDDATVTYVIPLVPQAATSDSPTQMSGSGVAYNGVRLDGPAPVQDILAAHTIAPFDDCGGHVNTHVGYHYHAVTDCLNDGPSVANHASQIGIAMDGYAIFAHALADGTAPGELDACNGHVADGMSYHYHAGEAGGNAILSCLKAQSGCASEDPDAVCDASAMGRPPRP